MSNLQTIDPIEAALIHGDLSKLSPADRVTYYNRVCESLGLNPLTKPFAYLVLNGKETLYAKKDATDQLRKIHKVSIVKLETQVIDGITVVTAYARDKDGKEDSEIGALDIKGLTGEKLANAMMKASTKAKRRVTLSICGLGFPDESEVTSIAGAETSEHEPIPARGNVVDINQPAIAPPVAPQIVQPVAQVVKAPEPVVVAAAPIADIGAYQIPFGSHKGKRLDAFGHHDLDGWVKFMRGLPDLGTKAQEAVTNAEAFLKSREVKGARQ